MKLVPLFPLLLLFVGCVTASVTALTTSYRPPTDPSQITIFLDARDIPGTYEKIGLINARGDSFLTNESMMMAKGRKEAAKLGANAILLSEIDEASQGAKVAAQVFGASTNRRSAMIAIFVHPGRPESLRLQPAKKGVLTESFEEWDERQ